MAKNISDEQLEEMKKGCFGKIQHKTKTAAQYYLDNYTAPYNFGIYKCKFCTFYHLGHNTKTPNPKLKTKTNDNKNKNEKSN